MVYELRTYTLHPGKVNDYLEAVRTHALPVLEGEGSLVGFWSTEIGPLNQVVHLWKYRDLQDRAEKRAGRAKNPRWTEGFLPQIMPLLVSMETKILTPADFSPLT